MRLFSLSALALTAAMGFSSVSQAQEAPQQGADPASNDAVVADEIVVTVQKREQAILDVPIALTAYNGAFLDQYGIDRMDELSTFVPGLEIQDQSPNNPAFVIRGITSDTLESNQEPRVAVFQDGVSISRSAAANVEPFDLERIEVAKGPQPTLFGRGALIGGVNLIQNKARTDRFEGSLLLSAGDYDAFRAVGVLNAPIIKDTLGARIAVSRRDHDGYVTNLPGGGELNDIESDALRLALRYDPTPKLRVDAIFNSQTDETGGTAFKSGIFAPQGGNTSPYSFASLNTVGAFDGGRTLGVKRKIRSGTVIAAYDVSSAFTLTSTTGYRYFEAYETFDPDGFDYPILISGNENNGLQWSEELRLNFEMGDRVTGFVGGFWFYEKGSQRTPLQFDERAALALFAGQITRPNPPPFAAFTNQTVLRNIIIGTAAGQGITLPVPTATFLAANLKPAHQEFFRNDSETTAIDLFGDVTVSVTDRLEVSAGLRWTQDDKTTGYRAALLNGPSVLAGIIRPGTTGLFAQPSAGRASRGETFDDFTWRLVGRYEVADNASVWASYARGRRPDVIVGNVAGAGIATGTVSFNIVPAEEVDSYEIGAKAALLDGRLTVDGSVFYYDYSNFQTTEFNGTTFVATNAGKASATGFEGAVNWAVTDALTVFANYGYNDAQFDSGARKGNRFRLSPENSFAVGGAWDVRVGGFGMLTLAPSYTWQSQIFFDDDNDRAALQTPLSPFIADTVQNEKQGSYGLLNLRADFQPAGSPVTVGAYVKNATDEEFLIDAGNTGDTLGSPTFIRGAPRTVGVEVKAKF